MKSKLLNLILLNFFLIFFSFLYGSNKITLSYHLFLIFSIFFLFFIPGYALYSLLTFIRVFNSALSYSLTNEEKKGHKKILVPFSLETPIERKLFIFLDIVFYSLVYWSFLGLIIYYVPLDFSASSLIHYFFVFEFVLFLGALFYFIFLSLKCCPNIAFLSSIQSFYLLCRTIPINLVSFKIQLSQEFLLSVDGDYVVEALKRQDTKNHRISETLKENSYSKTNFILFMVALFLFSFFITLTFPFVPTDDVWYYMRGTLLVVNQGPLFPRDFYNGYMLYLILGAFFLILSKISIFTMAHWIVMIQLPLASLFFYRLLSIFTKNSNIRMLVSFLFSISSLGMPIMFSQYWPTAMVTLFSINLFYYFIANMKIWSLLVKLHFEHNNALTLSPFRKLTFKFEKKWNGYSFKATMKIREILILLSLFIIIKLHVLSFVPIFLLILFFFLIESFLTPPIIRLSLPYILLFAWGIYHNISYTRYFAQFKSLFTLMEKLVISYISHDPLFLVIFFISAFVLFFIVKWAYSFFYHYTFSPFSEPLFSFDPEIKNVAYLLEYKNSLRDIGESNSSDKNIPLYRSKLRKFLLFLLDADNNFSIILEQGLLYWVLIPLITLITSVIFFIKNHATKSYLGADTLIIFLEIVFTATLITFSFLGGLIYKKYNYPSKIFFVFLIILFIGGSALLIQFLPYFYFTRFFILFVWVFFVGYGLFLKYLFGIPVELVSSYKNSQNNLESPKKQEENVKNKKDFHNLKRDFLQSLMRKLSLLKYHLHSIMNSSILSPSYKKRRIFQKIFIFLFFCSAINYHMHFEEYLYRSDYTFICSTGTYMNSTLVIDSSYNSSNEVASTNDDSASSNSYKAIVIGVFRYRYPYEFLFNKSILYWDKSSYLLLSDNSTEWKESLDSLSNKYNSTNIFIDVSDFAVKNGVVITDLKNYGKLTSSDLERLDNLSYLNRVATGYRSQTLYWYCAAP